MDLVEYTITNIGKVIHICSTPKLELMIIFLTLRNFSLQQELSLEQIDLCGRIVRESLSVRNIEQQVQRKLINDQTGNEASSKPLKTKSAQIELLEKQLKNALGTRVKIAEGEKGSGKVVINFNSSQEFSRLMNLLTVGTVPKDRAA